MTTTRLQHLIQSARWLVNLIAPRRTRLGRVAIVMAMAAALLPWMIVSTAIADEAEAPGMRVYVNPETGQIEEPPTPRSPRGPRAARGSTEAPPTPPPVVEIPAPDGNGVMIDGRPFRAEMRTEIGPDGKPVTHCDDAAADSGRKE